MMVLIPFTPGYAKDATMPAPKLKIAANRRNLSALDRPRPMRGRPASTECFEHGLTGDGVALPDEELPKWPRGFQDSGGFVAAADFERLVLRRFAYLSVRLERCERLDTAVLFEAGPARGRGFVDHRMAQVEALAGRLVYADDHRSRLQATPEGIDWLIATGRAFGPTS